MSSGPGGSAAPASAGVGAWCKGQRDGSPAALSGFLASRGLWLVLVEVTVMRVALNFSLSMQYPVLLLILWALGVSMLALAVLIHLPARALVLVSLALVVFHNALDGVSMVLKEYDKTVVEVAGHTDSTGSDQYNQGLSERRAQSVASYLSSHGVSSQRLITVGAGEAHPVASNDTEQGCAANRRVELMIVPVTKG